MAHNNTTTSETRYSFHLAIEPKATLVLAHCLELDIMASAPDEDQAIDALIKLIKAHLEYVFMSDAPLYSPAPSDRWAQIQNQKGVILDVNVKLTRKINAATAATEAPRSFYKHREQTLCLTP